MHSGGGIQAKSPMPLQYQSQTLIFPPGRSSVAHGKCCPKAWGEVLTQLGRVILNQRSCGERHIQIGAPIRSPCPSHLERLTSQVLLQLVFKLLIFQTF